MPYDHPLVLAPCRQNHPWRTSSLSCLEDFWTVDCLHHRPCAALSSFQPSEQRDCSAESLMLNAWPVIMLSCCQYHPWRTSSLSCLEHFWAVDCLHHRPCTASALFSFQPSEQRGCSAECLMLIAYPVIMPSRGRCHLENTQSLSLGSSLRCRLPAPRALHGATTSVKRQSSRKLHLRTLLEDVLQC